VILWTLSAGGKASRSIWCKAGNGITTTRGESSSSEILLACWYCSDSSCGLLIHHHRIRHLTTKNEQQSTDSGHGKTRCSAEWDRVILGAIGSANGSSNGALKQQENSELLAHPVKQMRGTNEPRTRITTPLIHTRHGSKFFSELLRMRSSPLSSCSWPAPYLVSTGMHLIRRRWLWDGKYGLIWSWR